MNDDRGDLLYQEPTREIIRKDIFEFYCYIILFYSFAFWFIIIIIYESEYPVLFYILTILFLSMGSLTLINAINIYDLKIYTNVIVLPYKSIKQILKREENYIEFDKIKEVYPNENTPEWYFTK